MWLYLLFAPGDGSLYSMRCGPHSVRMGVLHFKMGLVKVKNKPWEEQTSICWVHKRICWRTVFDSEEGCVCLCLCVCVCVHSIFPRSSPGSRTKETRQRKKWAPPVCKSSPVEGRMQMNANWRECVKQSVGLYLSSSLCIDVWSLNNGWAHPQQQLCSLGSGLCLPAAYIIGYSSH